MQLGKDDLLKAYRMMKTIREFEERLHVEFATGDIPGFVHLYAGEEASATGFCMHLDERDRIASNPSVTEFRRVCIERGMVTLRQDGFNKVTTGLTTVDEVLRVTEGTI